jgi:hypothetical protein
MATRLRRRQAARAVSHRRDESHADKADALEQAWIRQAGRTRRRVTVRRIHHELADVLYHLIEVIELLRPDLDGRSRPGTSRLGIMA